MGVSTNCGLMIGLPYDEFIDALPEGENSVDEFNEMIDDGGLDVGSIYYDSPRDENIVGKWMLGSGKCIEIVEEDEEKFLDTAEELERQFPNILFKLYMTLDVT